MNPDYMVSEDTFLRMLDQDPDLALRQAGEGRDLVGLAVALTYGKDLPQGREWGSTEQLSYWLRSERAKGIRRAAADLAVAACDTEAQLMRFYRTVRRRRGYGPLLKYVVRTWHERRNPELTPVTGARGGER